MQKYFLRVTKLMKKFMKVEVQAVQRELNTRAYGLAKSAAFGEFSKKNKISIAEVPTVVSLDLEVNGK